MAHCSLKVVGSVRKLERPNAMGHRIARVQQLRSTVARRMEGEKVGQMGAPRCIMQRLESPKWYPVQRRNQMKLIAFPLELVTTKARHLSRALSLEIATR